MKQEIQIVTAFFSINRKDWKGFQRTDELYFNCFKEWAKLKNKIVVYVEKEELRRRILEFRKSLGLENKTYVIVLDNIYDIAPDILDTLEHVACNSVHKNFRVHPNFPEVWNATYDYVMLLKMWCCADAAKRGLTNGMVAWMDFGYNHGGSIIDSSSNFNFLWEFDFPEKINVFLIQDLDDRPIFDIVFSMDTYIMGMMIVAPSSLWETFWNMMISNMRKLANIGIIDDDQNVILMCLRDNPSLFNTYKSSWQLPLKQFGGDHLALSPEYINYSNSLKKKNFKNWARGVKHKINCLKCAWRIYIHMSKVTIH